MKTKIAQNKLSENPTSFLRRLGWGYILDRRRQKPSFVKRLTRDHYPRLHMYVEEEGDNYVFDMHLDQKQASYQGQHMHNAEYDNEHIRREMDNLQQHLSKDISSNEPQKEKRKGGLNGSLSEDDKRLKTHKKPWWKKFF